MDEKLLVAHAPQLVARAWLCISLTLIVLGIDRLFVPYPYGAQLGWLSLTFNVRAMIHLGGFYESTGHI